MTGLAAARTGEKPVRVALHRMLADAVAVVDECWLPTDERADIAAVYDDRLDGFEIKSARDTLGRLPRQVGAYPRVFDRCTLVVAERHAASAWVPDWLGVIVVDQEGGFHPVRVADPNPGLHSNETLVRLLWKRDVAAELAVLRVISTRRTGWNGYSRQWMWAQLLDRVDLEGLRACVRRALVRRTLERAARGAVVASSQGLEDVGGAEVALPLALASLGALSAAGSSGADQPGKET